MLSNYADMEEEIQNAPQPYVLPKGKEVKARIANVNTGVSDKNGARWIMPSFDVEEDGLVIPWNDFFWDPVDYNKVDPSQVAQSKAKFSNFVKSFKIDLKKQFDWETDIPGHKGWLVVGQKTDDYGLKNTVSKYIFGPQGGSAQSPVETGTQPAPPDREEEIPF